MQSEPQVVSAPPYRPSCLFSALVIGATLFVGVPTIAGYHHAYMMRGRTPPAPVDSSTGAVASSTAR